MITMSRVIVAIWLIAIFAIWAIVYGGTHGVGNCAGDRGERC